MGRAEDLFARIEASGTAYVQELIETAKSEELFLDFKQSSDHGRGAHLDPSDAKNLARALSGFANADGGVVLWGIGTLKKGGADLAGERHPLADCRRFAALIDAAVSGRTIPPVLGVRSIPVSLDGGAAGFVATLVPASPNAPHQSVDGQAYLVRVGSSFHPVSHSVLAGMFGRQPRPEVGLSFIVTPAYGVAGSEGEQMRTGLQFMLVNTGPVVASDLYVSCQIEQLGGPNCRPHVMTKESARWQVESTGHRLASCLAKPDNRLAPFSQQQCLHLHLTFAPPITEGFRVKVVFGCAGSPPRSRELVATAAEVEDALVKAVAAFRAGRHDQEPATAFAQQAMGLAGLV